MLDLKRSGRATAVGAATGIVVGLVAVTPAAGFVSPLGAILLGGFAALPSYYGLIWRARTRLDDSLDVTAAHGLGGTVGALLTGVLATKTWNGATDGLLFGNPKQLLIQAAAVGAAVLFSGLGTFVLLKLIGSIVPLRVTTRDEGMGLDVTQHGEEAYAQDEGAIPEVRGLTINRVQGHGGEMDKVENYRGTTVKMELSEKVRLEIGVSDHFVKPTVDAILASARTGDVGDGKIFVLPVEKVYRIRTGEEDQAAVTPIADVVPA